MIPLHLHLFPQLLVGILFVVPLWITGIRKAPQMTTENWKELSPVGLWAALAHAFSVLALGAGKFERCGYIFRYPPTLIPMYIHIHMFL
jgi:hypothetical protein